MSKEWHDLPWAPVHADITFCPLFLTSFFQGGRILVSFHRSFSPRGNLTREKLFSGGSWVSPTPSLDSTHNSKWIRETNISGREENHSDSRRVQELSASSSWKQARVFDKR